MTERQICNHIVNELYNQEFSEDETQISLFPDDIKYYELAHPTGAILIRTGNTVASEQIGHTYQIESIEIVATIICRDLWEENTGLYAVNDRVRKTFDLLRFDNAKAYLTTKSELIFDGQLTAWVRDLTFVLPHFYFGE
jgi:hypothetical protein